MNNTLLKLLQSVDTPTVCNAIEVAQGKRGFDSFTRGNMLSSDPDSRPVVGYAVTAKISAIAESTEPKEVIRARRMDYYRAMSDGAKGGMPSVAVVEDVDYPNCIGAYWGEINTTVHKAFGMNGALTNGVMRDLGDMPEDFTVIATFVGPSHGFVHVKEINTTVDIMGMTVEAGDLVHADRHGAVVIPENIIDKLESAINKLLNSEKIILTPAKQEGFDFAAFEKAWQAFEEARV
ncbi:RraA family protein [Psychrobacter sp. DAB_AL32B]|uniref:RraA family protein n=1 Tax=Psychrobacter sp. DAB_AL32B TaxID=1028414 RepID=UPI000B7CE42A|nr:RraA family protein [Psychrobacter sp. DAB_AL32B]OXL17771.1 acyl transferase [Psychrobacter sp. DAB_AL32B]